MIAWTKARWDFASCAGASLCLGPIAASLVRLGPPDRPASWVWLVTVPLLSAVLAAPQLAMLLFIRRARSRRLCLILLGLSTALVGLYCWYLVIEDLTSSSTASLGLLFASIYLALFGAALALLTSWLHARSRTR